MRMQNIGFQRRKSSSKIIVLLLLVKKRRRRKGITIFSGRGITGGLISNLGLISGNINRQKDKRMRGSMFRRVRRMVRI